MYHIPVMLMPCIDALAIKPSGLYVDVTFGGGGHSLEILKQLDSKGRLIAFDQDPDAQANVPKDDRFTLIPHNFRHIKRFLAAEGITMVDGILGDLGVSSHQFDVPERGFSIRANGPLDMRMNTNSGRTAADILNTYEEKALANVLYLYGELKDSRKIAANMVFYRNKQKFETIDQLVEVLKLSAPWKDTNQYLARAFQAIRIEVNEELDVLKDFLIQGSALLKPEGRLVVMSYHSLEDRLVKHFFQHEKFEGEAEKDLYGNTSTSIKAINKKVIIADEAELIENPRARSAKLRIAEKI